MSNLSTGRRFAPTLFATVLTLAGILLFGRLGLWQIDRAREKATLQEQYEVGQSSVVELNRASSAALPRFQRVRARGQFDSAHQILLDNMPSAMGQPGYRVVTPLELEDGSWLLVDRGWRPMGPTRAQIPDVSVPQETRVISGQLDTLPRPGLRMGEQQVPQEGPWPRVMSYPDAAAAERVLGRKVLPGLVLLDSDQPDGYERAWQVRYDLGPERHIGYAVQWFAFAVIAVVIYVVLGIRRARASGPSAAAADRGER